MKLIATVMVFALMAGGLEAQGPRPGGMEHRGGPQQGPGGRWWNNPEMVQRIGINSDQQKKMDDIFQANRLRLVDLHATLQKDEMTLEPLMSSETPDETKILAQIDKVAQARARRVFSKTGYAVSWGG